MKILIFSSHFYPEPFKVNDLVAELQKRNHEVTIITGQPNYPAGKIFEGYSNWSKWRDRFGKSEILRVPIFPRGKSGLFRLAINYFVFVLSATILGLPRLKLKRYDYSIVFASSPITSALPAILYKYITKTPVAIWVQDLWPETVMAVGAVKNKFLYNLIGQLVRFIYKNSELLLLQSNSFLPSVLKWGGRREQIKYFPNWAEDQFAEFCAGPTDAVCAAGKASRFKILFAGNIGRAQGIETILAAGERTKSYPNLEWHFYGDGTLSDWLAGEIKSRGLSNTVFSHGRRPLEDMPRIYAEHNILLVSLKKDDALKHVLPSKMQTYLAAGQPILASGDGEIADTIKSSGAGLVSPADDSTELATNALIFLKMNSTQLNEMGQRGKLFYDINFNKINLIKKLEEYLSAEHRR